MKKIFFFTLFAINIFAQTFSINGVISDASHNNVSLVSANIYLFELGTGTISNENGEFNFSNLNSGGYTLRISYVGFEDKTINLDLNSDKAIEIFLKRKTILLNRALVSGTIPKFRETAVAFSDLSNKDIDYRLGTKEAVNILEGTPSAFISQQGSGVGEQRLNIRGFDQTNIAVMINGFPINNPENGEIYWSNWAGISDLIQSVNVQRGLSAIPYSISSIGGSVNFITTGIGSSESSLKIKTEFGSDNLKKNSISFSSRLSNNISLLALISKRTLDGFADQVYADEYTYFFSLGFVFNKHTFQLQFLGSPQEHGQRLTQLSISDWKKYGKNYNADWGYLNGKPLNLRDNEFQNPTINISHNWEISPELQLSNTVSLSRGIGGGTVPPYYPNLTTTEDGLIDFDKEWQLNSNNIDPTYHPTKNKSVVALRKGVHKNYRGSIISALKYNWNNFDFSFGIDGKYYEAQNYNEIKHLLGGDYNVWTRKILTDTSDIYLNLEANLGDKVDFNANSFTHGYGAFFQTEYKNNKVSAYINLAISNTAYNRIDYLTYFNTDPKRETGWNNFTSSTIKAGINYNINEENNVYLNLGNFSRAPLSFNVYDWSNNLYENVKNENIVSFEVGYGFVNSFSKLNLNYYYTIWDDKAFSQSYISSDSTTQYYYNIFGASARHTGLELDGVLNLNRNLSFTGMFTYALNKWTSDVDAYGRPESNPNDEIKYHAYTNDLYVGNHPMTNASLGIFFQESLSQTIRYYVNPIYSFYGRYYAQYSPELRTDPNEKNIQSWRLPDFYNIDFHTGLEFDLDNSFVKSIKLSLNVFNILNEENIVDATDGFSHDSKSANVWYGRGRWWSAALSITL